MLIQTGVMIMKILKIENDNAYFLHQDDSYKSLDLIGKDDLLHIANIIIDDNDIEMDSPEFFSLKNQAHNVIYKNIYQKLNYLIDRKNEFHDEINQTYKEEFEKYKVVSS